MALVFLDLNRYGIDIIVTCGAKKDIRLAALVPHTRHQVFTSEYPAIS